MNYSNLAMITAVTVAASAEAKSVTVNKKLTAKPVVAAFLLGIFLFIAGMASETVAQKFCYLIIITALLTNGTALFNALNPAPVKGK